jgi:hypothetical protein
MKLVRMLALIAVLGVSLLAVGVAVQADPCLAVYSQGPCVYHYDPAEYYTVGPGDPLYNPLYDRGGKVLLLTSNNSIDLSIYQPPNLTGFVADLSDEGYYFAGTDFTLILDGFSNHPTTYVNILVKFDNVVPSGCVPQIWINGVKLVGMTFNAGDLVVSTPTPYGNNYSDVKTFDISWSGCYGVHVWAFADADYDGKKDGGECFTAFSHDLMIPVQSSSWGAIKALYQ